MLAQFGMSIPLIAAPMSGGPSTPAMVSAATQAGGFGLLAAGYKTVEAIEAEIKAVRSEGIPFGVNVFTPNPLPVDPDSYRAYAAIMQREADQFGVTLPPEPIEDTDRFDDKIALLLADPVPMVSFTFGIPPRSAISSLQRAGSVTVQTVTTAEEAAQARDAGVDMLAVQAAVAGGHSGTLSPRTPLTPVPLVDLVEQIDATVGLPVLAAGGIATPGAVADVMRAGAAAAVVGTVLLRAAESGASATHQAALTDPARTETVLTHAFTGRPARGLRNAFIDAHEAEAPLGYPALHYLTSPLRKAAAAAGKPEYVHLWAGTGYRHATAEPTADILRRLAADL
ncbi:NAD(P)H-dependent flavin oxidoreductase YrpB, nitropropane dioxygenase family [Mycobacterium rhizamassiliense]|jgi:NAD(P)H-dependent flavin oxidoreductase YrpB (nitropropane dioxygenase family)|uniref:Propionate 3-nitronate monooxygenase n=1 Tax=Mycobacterium rhizamassiliense TaxID=1841860 RepID=A0A2U3NZ93_9MYCO|nr:nitronate monooxygenase [Mycobacterium rhizamassiliense]SPM36812.1 NAD(P)H-dependent flavin oxidoreductase YrpB, nitropropane dioxygenase family [Mycobacterium rhizamassiliense]